YKGLQLDFLFQFVKQKNFNFANTQPYPGTFSNQPAAYAQNWQQPGDIASYQLYTTGANRYKGLQLDFLFQFVKQKNFNFANTQPYPGTFSNQPAAYAQNWQQPGDIASYQLYTTGANQQAMQAGEYFSLSDGAVSDASFIRLKNISLSYDLPPQWTLNTKCRLALTAQNLLTVTNYKGADPEFTQGSTLPPLRVISFDVQLTF
ncbi:hypothetical protein VF13_37870, partial [Nostoc linckia z16]